MHGTGQFSNLICFNAGGTAAYLPSRKFDAMELWDEVDRLEATQCGDRRPGLLDADAGGAGGQPGPLGPVDA